MKSEAVEGIRRLRCFWPTALRDCELVAHEGQEGGGWEGGRELGAMQQMGEKKSVCDDILKP